MVRRAIARALVAAALSVGAGVTCACAAEGGEAALLEQLKAASAAQSGFAGKPAPSLFGADAFGRQGAVAAVRLQAPPSWSVTADRASFQPIAEAAAAAHGIDADFFKRLIRQESGFNPGAVSRAGAQGIAQFMPATAALVGLDDPFDPAKALPKSAEFLSTLRARLGNDGLAAAAYNAGEGRVRAWLPGRAPLPAETQGYVMAITGRSAESWAPAGATLIGGIGAAGFGGAVPTFSRVQSAEWRLAATMMGAQPTLVGLLEAAAGQRPARVARGAVVRHAAPLRGERALCESMRATGCIVAAVY